MKYSNLVFFYLLLLSICNRIGAQDSSILKFTYYNFSDSVQRDDRCYGYLSVTKNSSYFYSYPYDFNRLGAGMHMVDSTPGNKHYIYYTAEDTLKRFINKNFGKNEIVFETERSLVLREKKVYSDSLHNIHWVISEEKSKIDSFYCTKATAFYRGRNYTAWFDESIAINNGPWKFGGLPGLIILIFDDKKRVFWCLKKIEFQKTAIFPILFPYDGNFASYQRDLKEAYVKRKRVMESHGTVTDPSCTSCTGSTTFRMNPIEIFFNEDEVR